MANRKRGTFLIPEELRTSEKLSTKKELAQRKNVPPCPSVPKIRKGILASGGCCQKPKPVYFKNNVSLSSSYDPDLNVTYFEQMFSGYNLIGEGSFGKVFRVINRENNKYYAVKRLKSFISVKDCYTEVKNNENIGKHPNIVRFYMAWEENLEVYMLLEYCEMSLSDFSKLNNDISEDVLWSILYDICKALYYLHGRDLLHLDVKPGNIMMKDGFFKLGDFGILVDLNLAPTMCKTLSDGDSKYLALEVLERVYKPSCDIFGLGISLLELAADLELPGHGPLWQQLRHEILPQAFYDRVSLGFKVIIERMLKPDYNQRPSAEKILKYKTVIDVEKRDKKQQRINYILDRSRLNASEEISIDLPKILNNNNVISTPPCAHDANLNIAQFSFRDSSESGQFIQRKILFRDDENISPNSCDKAITSADLETQGEILNESLFAIRDPDSLLAIDLSSSNPVMKSISMEFEDISRNTSKEQSMEIDGEIELQSDDIVTSTPIVQVKAIKPLSRTKLSFK